MGARRLPMDRVELTAGPEARGVLDLDALIRERLGGRPAAAFPRTAVFLGLFSSFASLSPFLKALVGTLVSFGLMTLSRLLQRPALEVNVPRTYGFQPSRNDLGHGLPIPVIYGEHRVFPPVVQQFITSENDLEFLHVLYAVAQGEIESLTLLEINDQPSASFQNVQSETRLGTAGQTVIPWFQDVRNTFAVGVSLPSNGSAHTYTTVLAIDAFIVTIRFPSGMVGSAGGVGTASSVVIRVEYRVAGSGGAFTSVGDFTVAENKPNVNFTRQFRKDGLARGTFEIRVTRVSSSEVASGFQCQFDAVDEIAYGSSTYPMRAMLGLRIQATDQLSGGAPRVSIVVKGRKVRALTGGALGAEAWSQNPVECLIDLMRSSRYGLGGRIADADLVLSTFQTAKDYCNDTVTDPPGVSEARHKLDLVIDERRPAYEWLDILQATFRGRLVEADEKWRLSVDHTAPISQVFTDANVLKDSFKTAWVSLSEEHEQVEVHFLDAGSDWAKETVRFPTGAFNKVKPIQLIGVTRRSHALREAKYHLNAISALSQYAEFDCALEALASEVGDRILVAHDVPQWGFGGRVVKAVPSDVALTAGMITAQGVSEFSAASLIDADQSTKGWNAAGAIAGDWVQVDLGTTKTMTRLRVLMIAAGATAVYDVQHSDNGSTWANASTGWTPASAGWNERTWGAAGAHRWWRVRVATAGTGSVYEWEWSTAASTHVVTVDRGELPTGGLAAYAFGVRHLDDVWEQISTISAVSAPTTTTEGYPRQDVTLGSLMARPPVGRSCQWVFGLTAQIAKSLRIVALTLNADLTRHLAAIEYNEAIYDASGLVLPTPSPSLLPNPDAPPNDVTGLVLTERRQTRTDGSTDWFVEVSWNQPVLGGGSGQFAYARVFASLYQGADATLLINSAIYQGRADHSTIVIGPFPPNLSPNGTKVRVYVVAVSVREVAQPIADAAFADLTFTSAPIPAWTDHFNYAREPGDEVDPQIWTVERAGAPDIDHTAENEALLHTGATNGNNVRIHSYPGIQAVAPLRTVRQEWRARFDEAVGATTFHMGMRAPTGYVFVNRDPQAFVEKGTTAGTIKFRTNLNEIGGDETTDNITLDVTAYHVYAIEIDSSLLAARLYVDNVLKATHTLKVSTLVAAASFLVATGENADKHLRLDYAGQVGIL